MEDCQHEVDALHQRRTGALVIAIFDQTASNPGCRTSRACAAFDDPARLEVRAPPSRVVRTLLDKLAVARRLPL